MPTFEDGRCSPYTTLSMMALFVPPAMKIPTWPGLSKTLFLAIEYEAPPSPSAIPDPDALDQSVPSKWLNSTYQRFVGRASGVVQADDILGVPTLALVVADVPAANLVELDEIRAVQADTLVRPEDLAIAVPFDANVGGVRRRDGLRDAGEVVVPDRHAMTVLEMDRLDVGPEVLEGPVLDDDVLAVPQRDRG